MLTYAAFFCAGLLVGLLIAVPILTIFWMTTKRVAEWSYKQNLMKIRANTMKSNKLIEDEVKRYKDLYGPGLTREKEQILQEELASVLRPTRQDSDTPSL